MNRNGLSNPVANQQAANTQPANAAQQFARTHSQPVAYNSLPDVDVRIDFENLYLGLEQAGLTTDFGSIIAAIQLAVGHLGNRITRTAYADWNALFKRASFDVQYALRRLGVEICEVVSQRGKNSCDMKIVDDVRTALEQDACASAARRKIVLVTGDSDFCTVVETSQKRGHQVIIVSLRSCLSRALEQIADEVHFLDDLLPPQANNVADHVAGIPAYAGLVMRIVHQLQQRAWTWIFVDKLTLSPAETELLRQAIAAGVFIRSERPIFRAGNSQPMGETIELNFKHPLLKVISHLCEWLPKHLAHCLHERHMPHVDSNYLARGMALNHLLRQYGVGQTRQDVEKWLDLAASTGIIVKKQQAHPDSPFKIINTWWLPEENHISNIGHPGQRQLIYTIEPTVGTCKTKTPAADRIKSTTASLPKSNVRNGPLDRNSPAAFLRSTTSRPISVFSIS
jgi:hypothetical protein